MEQLVEVSLDLIDDHPDNPRITFREDVIDAIAMGINGAFQQKHAVHVRPAGDRYQLLAGHHRKRAAQRRGLAKIWAWVEDMDDEAAHMALATSNNQGELSPIEIGMHALKAVPLGTRGRGNKQRDGQDGDGGCGAHCAACPVQESGQAHEEIQGA